MAHGYRHSIGSQTHRFRDLKDLLAKASPARAGDALAGLCASSTVERSAARLCLATLPLKTLLDEPLVPYEEDEITRLILDTHDAAAFARVSHLTVGDFRNWLLAESTSADTLAALAPGITPEMAAAVSKLMRNQDLVQVARKCRVVTRFRDTLGLPGRLAVRLQPNHPSDDLQGIAASILDGLLYGAGDAVIGINPAGDDPALHAALWRMLDELIARCEIPTQSCVLTHVTGQIAAIEQGLPVDLVFQSIGGTEATNRSFGVDLALLAEARDAALSLRRGGEHVMYFETGQGSALSANAHHGVDQQTCEARAYAVARAFSPLLVNSVVGFIGPEYLYDGKQIVRAGLEDHFCGKLMGLPLGCDVCYTNHAEADQDDMDTLLTLLGTAGVTFIMGVPGADDVMLNYQSTSFHDALYLREVLGLKHAPEFEAWLERMQVTRHGRLRELGGNEALVQRLLARLP
ncbi:MAG TPA: ethanolamine ammonia-lyase subunit EutB [Gammaproteobacteria bacterium]|nr:ethanolamine ammonia-lyase subunit EutB [Gammaproteobacteria bacterium]